MTERTLIRGGTIISMDPVIGDLERGDVLIEGKKIARIGPQLEAADAAVIDAAGMIVAPGFIDTHHHQSYTALRSVLPDGLFANDGKAHGKFNYVESVLGKFPQHYRPQDVYISELVGFLSQLDAGVTTANDISQIHHSREHTEAAIQAIADSGARATLTYGSSRESPARGKADALHLRKAHFASDDQLMTMIIGNELMQPGFEEAWAFAREMDLPIACHVVGSAMGMGQTFDRLAAAGKLGPDNLFIHMTGVSDLGWKAARDAGAAVSLAVPIEMTMRLGMPSLLKSLEVGIQPSLSSDYEGSMTADFFTQMRTALTLQRALVNEEALAGKQDLPELLTSKDVMRFATLEGAKALKLERKVGSLAPGKEADIIILDATAINVMPLNHAFGAVVTLMDRSDVDTVIVAGQARKRGGQLLGVDLPKLRKELEASRDHLFETAGVPRDLFRSW